MDNHNIAYEFIDYKKHIPSEQKLSNWIDKTSLDAVYNANSAVFKKLDLPKNANKDEVIALCQKHPNIIKRPILETEKEVILGFDKAAQAKYELLFKA